MLSWDLDDHPDLENHALQACKSLQAMMLKVICNPTISLKTATVDGKDGTDGGILTSEKVH
eukprot:7394432-Ditylum_brightwellii.AAC.1